jgi:hypothetical protein
MCPEAIAVLRSEEQPAPDMNKKICQIAYLGIIYKEKASAGRGMLLTIYLIFN